MRKDRNLRTYGRHKNRVIVSDIWFSDNEKKQGGVFSTSSDSSRQNSIFHSSSSSENGGLSLNSTGNSDHSIFGSKSFGVQTRSTKKAKHIQNKENEYGTGLIKKSECSKSNRRATKTKKQILSISSSTDDSLGSERIHKTRALRDRNQKIDYNDSVNLKKQLRGTTAKRKRAVKQTNNTKACKDLSVNFSDFENYSLVVSDSPSVDVRNVESNLLSVETSTPVAKRTRQNDSADDDDMKVTDISHIEMVSSPENDASVSEMHSPASTHSQFFVNTPSVISSYCSDELSSWSKMTGDSANKLPSASVRLNKLRESFISRALSGGAKSNLAESRVNQASKSSSHFNNSDSLFSPTYRNLEKNLSLSTKCLENVRCRQLYNDSDTEKANDVTENIDSLEEQCDEKSESEEDIEGSDEDSETEGDSEDNESEENGSDTNNSSRDRDLSAIHEDEEVSEDDSGSESDCEESDTVESESDENESDCVRRVTRNQEKNSKSNLERLSESLLMNHVNHRRTTRSTKVIQSCDEDMDDLAELLDQSHIDSSESNATLYLLNDDKSVGSRQSSSTSLSAHEEESSELVMDESRNETGSDSKSAYHTAQSSRHSDNDTADDDDTDYEDYNGDDDKVEEEKMAEDLCTPSKNQYSLRGKFQELQNSFSELLTPKRRKSSMVPLSARAKILVLCDQTEPITFTTALTKKMISKCKKIGEGVYGEVFRAINSNGDSVAIKIIPIEGDFDVNDEPQKKFEEILPEVVIAKELSNLRNGKSTMTSNFCEVNNVSCVKGRYPAELIRQWDVFHKDKGSENDRPHLFPDKQLYIVFEFADCGTDLSSYKFSTIQQAKSVLTQVAYALAVAEETLQFEHRDLHWGNVLIRPTDKEDIIFRLMGKPVTVPSQGVEACVIDFTMSRLTKDHCTVYITIPDDDTLFDGKGDYQFDIYREMKKENKGNWEKFNPHSNVLWLHYLADKLVYSMKYPSQSSRQERDILREFRQFMSTMLDYSNSAEMAVDSLFMNS